MNESYKTCAIDNNYIIYITGKIYSIRNDKFLKPFINNGYYCVNFSSNGKRKRVYIHELVASHFLIKIPEYEVNHKDGNKLNNDITNLEYVTVSQNIKHAYDNGLIESMKGIKNHRAKLSEIQVTEIRKLYKTGVSVSILVKMFNISRTNIRNIINMKRWKHL